MNAVWPQVDPDLRRTVVVSTKFDTRLPQFSRAEDIERVLRPPARTLDTSILGGSPFFTSVPSGRVGHTRESVFRSDEHFRAVRSFPSPVQSSPVRMTRSRSNLVVMRDRL